MDLINKALNFFGMGDSKNNSTIGKNNYKFGENPYQNFYDISFGFIFGKPLSFSAKADPNQRVYQKTMLRNNTLINIVPGIPYQDENMIEQAKDIFKRFQEEYDIADKKNENEMDALLTKYLDELTRKKVDLRFAVFKQDIASFLMAYQILINRTGTAIFGAKTSTLLRDATEIGRIAEDKLNRGFKVWVEKGTSISETVENSFQRSELANLTKTASGLVKEIKFLGDGFGMTSSAAANENVEVDSSNAKMQEAGSLVTIANAMGGAANFDFPQIYDESKFNRSYEISFRFVSPYGDDRSIANYVIFPFLFLLTCALPRQHGTSSTLSPFLLQIDAPGFFSCPMGVVTSFSFRKGGDEMLFNERGLPLVVEGSMSITDLYSNLSLPLNHGHFATNFGTAAFLNNIGGLNLYSVIDQSSKDMAINTLKGLVTKPLYYYNKVAEETYNVRRYLGI